MAFSIETERLILRDLRLEDALEIAAQSADLASYDFLLPWELNRANTLKWVRSSIASAAERPRGYYGLAITLKDTGALIGSCALTNAKPKSTAASAGWTLGSRFWNRGYGTEAARQLLYIGFEIAGVSRIIADCFAHNAASIRVMEKIGMHRHRSGLGSQYLRAINYGQGRPIVRYQIWKDEWLAAEKAGERSGNMS